MENERPIPICLNCIWCTYKPPPRGILGYLNWISSPHRINEYDPEFVKCTHPSVLDPVTGLGEHYCSTMRTLAGKCGRGGKLYKGR